MATLTELDALIVGCSLLRQRFRAARLKAAWDVINEAETTQHHTERLAWANKIVGDYDKDLDKEYRWACSNAVIQSSGDASTDSDINSVVSGFVNAWAGV
jgi:hypothetical protein